MAPQASSTPHALSDRMKEELETCTISSSLDLGEEEGIEIGSCSTYHIYHKKERHARLTPTIEPSYERLSGPPLKEVRAKRKERKARKLALQQSQPSTISPSASPLSDGLPPTPTAVPDSIPTDSNAFFLHSPYLSFHSPPRVLYTGSTKHAAPTVLIHSSFLWRSYKLQFGPSIATPGVLDPRGVVCWKHNGGDKKARKEDGTLLKGYKVKTWRLWGETGKTFVHKVKANRKAEIGPDPDVLEDREQSDVFCEKPDGMVPEHDDKSAIPAVHVDKQDYPISADEVVYLTWSSPFSRDTRRYHFHFHGIDFSWKGTGSVKETRTCGWGLRFNHLKLVADVPIPMAQAEKNMIHNRSSFEYREVCLAKYTSSIAVKKSGKLDVYEGAIWRLMSEHMPELLPVAQVDSLTGEFGQSSGDSESVTKTLLYQLVVATAMCMIISEKQKRETLKEIIIAAITEGAGGAAC